MCSVLNDHLILKLSSKIFNARRSMDASSLSLRKAARSLFLLPEKKKKKEKKKEKETKNHQKQNGQKRTRTPRITRLEGGICSLELDAGTQTPLCSRESLFPCVLSPREWPHRPPCCLLPHADTIPAECCISLRFNRRRQSKRTLVLKNERKAQPSGVTSRQFQGRQRCEVSPEILRGLARSYR